MLGALPAARPFEAADDRADLVATVTSERLTAAQLRVVSAQWRKEATGGDETARRIADTLDWIASLRAKQEAQSCGLMRRIFRWMQVAPPK